MIGDSTMADKPLHPSQPERGWGQLLPVYLKHPQMVRNYAKNGRSSKSFIDEGLWNKVFDALQKEDWVIIQFGHNDEKRESPERYTDPNSSYRENLRRFIRDTQSKGAYPILATPIVRRKFSQEGDLVETHGDYPQAVRVIASELNIPLIDLHARSRELVSNYGSERSKALYLWIDRDLFKTLQESKKDDTHLSSEGAARICELAIDELRRLQHPLVLWFK
jgi:DNA sulfur modification protein DndE